MEIYDREAYDVEDVETALHVLHSALTDDLEVLEAKIRAVGLTMPAAPTQAESEMSEYHAARAALHSGLVSIAEVLGWIQWKTEEEPEGEVAVALQPLPTLRGCSIH
ncbi:MULTISPECIES: hypothetical protein [unclassified Duganella]|uniref:hypothetical protein n=1 Tax=unclassified Duganella TaxID=2636909 RepID=UPI0012E3D540|nr:MULTISPECIES: hypothetical protein [unclassified Duganella]